MSEENDNRFRRLQRYYAHRSPFWWVVSKSVPTYSEKGVERITVYRNAIVIPQLWVEGGGISDKDFRIAVTSAYYSLVSRHPSRLVRFSKIVAQAASSLKAAAEFDKDRLDGEFRKMPPRLIRQIVGEHTDSPVEQIRLQSVEEIAERLEKGKDSIDLSYLMERGIGVGVELKNEVLERGDGDEEAQELEKGDARLHRFDSGQLDRALVEIVASSEALTRQAGRDASTGQRILKDVIRFEKKPWWMIIRDILTSDFKKVISTWQKPSRKHPELPGHRWWSVGEVWCMVDVSGSIKSREYDKFISVMLDIARYTSVHFVPWDTRYRVYDKIIKREEDLPKDVKGYGGTTPNCLVPILKKVRKTDWIVVLTDGCWTLYDDFLEEIKKHPKTILVLTEDGSYRPNFRHVVRIPGERK